VYLDQVIRDSDVHNIERNTAFKEFVQNIREPGDMAFHVPSGLRGSLRDYQKLGFKWLKTLSHYKLGGILADDMEEKILSLQEKKRRLTDAVIRPGETFISKMTMDEIQALFE
jgi:SNF2 family DNA or RNA helicase